MRALTLGVMLSIMCGACDHPADPRPQAWIAGRWLLVDSIVVDYAFADYLGSDTTVSFTVEQSRDATLDLSPVGRDSMAATIRGTFHAVRRSSPFGARTEVGDETYRLDGTDTIRVSARYIYGMYATDDRDSIPVPTVPAPQIDWVADSLFVCGSWLRGLDLPGSKFVPEAFACRQRIHWRRP